MTLLLAHRGASNLAPENTLAAFRKYQEFGAAGTEFDVQICATGEIVCFHDDTPARTTNYLKKYSDQSRAPRISELPWSILKDLDAGAWKGPEFADERIPLLQEVLACISPAHFLAIEIKCKGWPDKRLVPNVLDILRAAKRTGKTYIGSFNPHILRQWKKLRTEFPIGLISEEMPPWYNSRNFWLPLLQPEVLYLQKFSGMKEEIERNHQQNRQVILWTVDTVEAMHDSLIHGADGIISNRPELFQHL